MPSYSVQVGPDPPQGEGRRRRNPAAKDTLISKPRVSVSTIYDILLHASKEYAGQETMGTRKLIKEHVEERKLKKTIDGQETEVAKKWSTFELGPYEYVTYEEFGRLAHAVGCGLRKLGLQPKDRVQIFARTSAKWMTAAQGPILSLLISS
jgi:long-chain acyl-CoA synthetase